MGEITLGEASIRLVLKNGKLVVDINERLGPIPGPPLEIELNPADAVALFTKGFGAVFAPKK